MPSGSSCLVPTPSRLARNTCSRAATAEHTQFPTGCGSFVEECSLREFLQTSRKAPGTLYLTFFVPVCHENPPPRLILFKEGYSMKFGKACCALRKSRPRIENSLPCYTGIDHEKSDWQTR